MQNDLIVGGFSAGKPRAADKKRRVAKILRKNIGQMSFEEVWKKLTIIFVFLLMLRGGSQEQILIFFDVDRRRRLVT
jgi:hypothetical protein